MRTLIQPLLLVFVFTFVFPKTGQSVGGSTGASRFSTQLVAGVMGLAIVFQGIQAVALPLVQEFGVSPRDRRPRARAAADVDGRAAEDRHRSVAGSVGRVPGVPDRGPGAGDARPPQHPLADTADPGAARPDGWPARSG